MHSKPKSSAASRPARPGRSALRPTTRRAPARRAAPTLLDRHSGALQHLGGSLSDEWNDRLAAETVEAIPQLTCETREQKVDAAVQGLIGLAPQDELEGIMAAELIAGHAAAMDCYRRAATATSFAERREQLNQAIRLSRVVTTLVNALQRRRGPRGSHRERLGMTRFVQGANQPSTAAHAKSAKQPCAAAAATAPTESAKQPSAAAPAPAELAKQPSAAANASAPGQAKSAKQPSGRETAEVDRACALASTESAKQPWPIPPAPALGLLPLANRTPGASRARAAALMAGTSHRIAE